jgi:hypothetical protein
MPTDIEKRFAYMGGRLAVRTGKPVKSCPYKPSAGPKQLILTLWFVRGYRSASASGVTYD